MATGTPMSGSRTRVSVSNGTYLGVEEWKVDPNSPLTEITNTESPLNTLGHALTEFFATHVGCKVTARLFYNSAVPPFVTPSLQAGATLSINRLYLSSAIADRSVTSQPHFYFATWIVESPPVTVRIKDKIMLDCTFQVSGLWYYPTATGNAGGL